MAQHRGYRTSLIVLDDFFGEPISVIISEDDEEKKPDRLCDGKHCAGCLCSGLCDLKDSIEHDEEGW